MLEFSARCGGIFQSNFWKVSWKDGSQTHRITGNKIFPLRVSCATRSHHLILGSAAVWQSHVWVLFGDPFDCRWGVVHRRFFPLYIILWLGTLGTNFTIKSFPKESLQKTMTEKINFDYFPNVLDINWRLASKNIQTLYTGYEHYY